ncbi:uncharacterized protein A1O9_08234 [Exophiala aquamarina CBS 119918]|uniref:CENP-V/GFA domain-containing protein n=1 Tax=Exophiala aquamarina CBS 119918 TaxID=1182545 RepID=A0A072P5V5_9EURO|nr:uncharacterized protein A1O9_08234 [Exophiala aquamarina CBS 119918]KEF55484.1 hypothetical protein A1O9_08234 [Exophiala aquamarina CBS 119918]
MDTVKGSCLCSAITFSVQGAPENVMQCFCTHCAKNAGAPYQYVAKFKTEQVQVSDPQDARKTYVLNDTMSGSDKHKVFCGVCGCTLWTIPMRHGGTHYVVRTALIDNG